MSKILFTLARALSTDQEKGNPFVRQWYVMLCYHAIVRNAKRINDDDSFVLLRAYVPRVRSSYTPAIRIRRLCMMNLPEDRNCDSMNAFVYLMIRWFSL